jgi:hypothetical protein
MAKKSETVRKLIRELEIGKKKLRIEFNRGLRALDEAIATLERLELDATALVKAANPTKKGRPSGGNINLTGLVSSKSGKRGRSTMEEVPQKQTLTQMIFDSVQAKKKFVHQRDIAALLLKKFPEEDKVEFSKKISVMLAALKKRNKLVTINQGGYRRNIFWGLPTWLNAEGKVLKTFENKSDKPVKKTVKR